MTRTVGLVILAALSMVACGGTGAVAPTPSPSSVTPSASPIAVVPSPPPPPTQRMEMHLPVALEEAAAAVAGGKLYVIGGFDAAGNSLRTVWVFDGTTWAAGPPLPLGLDHTSAASLNDHVYVAGGHSVGRDSPRFFRLDGSSWTELAPMKHARGGHALLEVGTNLYVIGGNTVVANVAPAEVYDPRAGNWTDLPPLPAPRNHVAGFVYGPDACAAGGRSPTTSRVDCYDPLISSWVRLPDLPQPTSGAGAAALEDGSIVILGGEDARESTIVNQSSVLSAAGPWTVLGAMLVPRHGFELALFQGRAWACGGGVQPGLHPVATCTSIG